MPRHRLPSRSRSLVLALASLVLTLPACGKSEGPRGSRERPYRIAVIPKGMTHEFWRTIHAGAIRAQRDLAAKGVHVELVWKGPLREDDREQQVQVVESFASQGIDGIVLAPLDEKALVRPVEEAARLKVPTVIMDSALASDQIVSFVATDNYKGGELGADALGQAMNGKGKILLLRYAEGSASTTAREAGFLARREAAWPGLELVSSDQYAGATRDTAKRAAENLLNRYGRDLAGHVRRSTSRRPRECCSRCRTRGSRARSSSSASTRTRPSSTRCARGSSTASCSRTRSACAGSRSRRSSTTCRAGPSPKLVDTGVSLVTPANLDAPEMQALLKPPLDQYLKPGE